MSEREATELLERLAGTLPPTFPPTAALVRDARLWRRRRRVVRSAGAIAAVAGVVGLGVAVWPTDVAPDVPAASTRAPVPPSGTHWEGYGGALLAVPDDGTVSLRTRPFGAEDRAAWELPISLSDAKPVTTVTRGPDCTGEGGRTTCRSRMAIPSLHVLVVVEASGVRAPGLVDEVLDSVTYVDPAGQAGQAGES